MPNPQHVDPEQRDPSSNPEGKPEATYTTESCDTCAVGNPKPMRVDEFCASFSNDCRACAGISRFLALQTPRDKLRHWLTPGSSRDGYEFFVKTPRLDMFGASGASHNVGADPSPSTSSAQAFDTLKGWISRCEADHKRCGHARPSALPHRILKIESIEPMAVCLVEDDPAMEKYACLSYRWGPNTGETSLRSTNLEVYKGGVPNQCLYPLVIDAVTAAWRLGLKYIWIDSYCIIQDSEVDWSHEAASMGDIYENAFITIAAATDGGRLFFKTDPSNIGHPITEVEQRPVFIRPCLFHPRLTYLGSDSPSSVTDEADKYTAGRGWIFQERILSKRFVHFLKDELFWECRERTWCECRSEEASWEVYRSISPRVLDNTSWTDLIRNYCLTAFTFEKDRLQALLGVARRYGAVHGKTFLAGMWFENLPFTFLWQHFLGAKREPRPLVCTAPSWSWMVLSVQDQLPRQLLFTPCCDLVEFLGHRRGPPVADIYADPHSVRLTLAGPMVMGTIFPRKQYVSALRVLWHMDPDFDMQPDDPSKFRAVEEGSDVLILLCYIDSSSFQCLILQDVAIGLGSDEGIGESFQRIGDLGSQVAAESLSKGSSNDNSSNDSDDLSLLFLSSSGNMDRQRIEVTGQGFLDQAERRTITLV